MSDQPLLDLSATVERALCVIAVVAAAALVLRARGRRPAPIATTDAWEQQLSGRRELACLAAVCAGAFVLRTVGCTDALTAPYWFAHTATVRIATMLASGALGTHLRGLLTTQHLTLLEDSAVMLPVAAAFQWFLGPSLHLPTLIGAFFGTATVVLAWWLGRRLESRVFGLLFAAFLAVSPLAIVWSRHGGVWIGAPFHVLLVLALAAAAGQRGSLALGGLVGAAIWATFLHYYAARTAIPLAFAGLAFGAVAGHRRVGRTLAVAGAALAVVAAVYAVVRPAGLAEAIWPRFHGYVGNRQEHTLGDLAASVRDNLLLVGPRTLRVYFWQERASGRLGGWAHPSVSGGSARTPGMEGGGLALAPVTLLGVLGLLRCLRRPRRRGLWLLLAVAGLAAPVLSAATARRLLVFDAAWCGLAAGGAVALVDARMLRVFPARAVAWSTSAGLVALGTWSFTSIVLLNGVLPSNSASIIPFGESGFGDGRACLGCVRAAYRWQDEIAAGRMVVLFDDDAFRENPTMPGGLSLYGKIAALAAGHPTAFVPFYPLMANHDIEPPNTGILDRSGRSFSALLAARIEETRPVAIVWDFEQPTVWERWVAERLEAAGGRRVNLPPTRLAMPEPKESAVSDRVRPEEAAFTIVTPWAERRAALAVLDRIAQRGAPARDPCITFDHGATTPQLSQLLAPITPTAGHQGPHWLIATPTEVRLGTGMLPVGSSVGLGYTPGADETVHVLTHAGEDLVWHTATGRVEERPRVPRRIGLGCVVFLGDRWWGIDSLSGEAFTSSGGGELPRGRWVGIAPWSETEVALASAEQSIHVVDVTRGTETLAFPAHVAPTRRHTLGECSLLAVGDDWVVSLDPFLRTLAVYDRSGAPLGVARCPPSGARRATCSASPRAAHIWRWGRGRSCR